MTKQKNTLFETDRTNKYNSKQKTVKKLRIKSKAIKDTQTQTVTVTGSIRWPGQPENRN